jgi:LmbE family N-acetylglucosaminyl deacetylase
MLALPLDWSRFRSVLCLGAHCDDIEIGCGGTIQWLCGLNPALRFHWMVASASDVREAETRAAAAAMLPQPAHVTLEFKRFRGSYLPQHWAEIKDCFEELKQSVQPDLILTHRLHDRHQDHKVIAELTWNTFRDHLILEYEIPKFEGDLGQPNVYVPLPSEVAERKIELLMEHFPTQHARSWFRPEVFSGLMNLRAIECNAASGYAEAFHARKLVL